ncbi:hypothetical protein [Rhizobacter fulvus]
MSPTADDTAVTAPPAIDWQSVETAYRTTARSVREIAAAHGVSHVAILKRAKRDAWERAQTPQVASMIATESAVAPAITREAVATLVTAKKRQSAAAPVTASPAPTKGSKARLFKSPDPENLIYLANTAGHTFVVGAEFAEIPAAFHRKAILAGCEVSGTLSPENQKEALMMRADKDESAAAEAVKRNSFGRGRDSLDNEHSANGVHLVR